MILSIFLSDCSNSIINTEKLDEMDFNRTYAISEALEKTTAAVSELRTLTPKLPELPNVNLQSAFRDLTGLTAGLPQHTQALAGIATKFGSALTAGGFSLDTLVSDASSAIGAGTSLSASIPNFVRGLWSVNTSK